MKIRVLEKLQQSRQKASKLHNNRHGALAESPYGPLLPCIIKRPPHISSLSASRFGISGQIFEAYSIKQNYVAQRKLHVIPTTNGDGREIGKKMSH